MKSSAILLLITAIHATEPLVGDSTPNWSIDAQELRYQKVTVHIYSFAEPSVKLHESLGFQLEGRIRRAVFTNGQYFDELIYGLTKEEFAALGVGQPHFLSDDRT
jgi:RimJ/RimL family protein N-acetyltransferase